MSGEPEVNLEQLVARRLSVHDVDGRTAERIRVRAHAVLAQQHARSERRLQFERFYSRFLEPVFVSAMVVTYLGWAINRVLFLYQWLH